MPSQQLTQLPLVLEEKADAGSVGGCVEPELATSASVKAELLLPTATDGSAACIGYHSTSGSPTLLSPRERECRCWREGWPSRYR